MRAVIQRVRSASVEIEGTTVGEISKGLLVLLGAAKGDDQHDVRYMVEKIPRLRIFSDSQGKMNLSLAEVKGEILMVSQFTLLANTDKGRRPGFDLAAPPDQAQTLYNQVVQDLRFQSFSVETGRFGASMVVSLHNDGPVTFILDSRKEVDKK